MRSCCLLHLKTVWSWVNFSPFVHYFKAAKSFENVHSTLYKKIKIGSANLHVSFWRMLQDYGVWGVLFIYFGAFAPFFTHVRLFSYNYSIHLKWHFQYYWKLKLARANIVGRMIKFLEFKHIFSALKIRCVQKVTNPLKWEDSNIKPFSGFCGQMTVIQNPHLGTVTLVPNRTET